MSFNHNKIKSLIRKIFQKYKPIRLFFDVPKMIIVLISSLPPKIRGDFLFLKFRQKGGGGGKKKFDQK